MFTDPSIQRLEVLDGRGRVGFVAGRVRGIRSEERITDVFDHDDGVGDVEPNVGIKRAMLVDFFCVLCALCVLRFLILRRSGHVWLDSLRDDHPEAGGLG